MSHVTNFLTGTAIALSLALGGTTARAGDPDLIAFDWSSFQLPDLLATYVTQHGDMPTFSIFADAIEARMESMTLKARQRILTRTAGFQEFTNEKIFFLQSGSQHRVIGQVFQVLRNFGLHLA